MAATSALATPVVLFGDSIHNATIFHRTGFLAPDPVVVVDTGDSVTLWVSQLEFGRAQKESSATVRCTAQLDQAALMRAAGSEAAMWASLVAKVCAEHGLRQIAVDDGFPAVIADRLRADDIAVEPTVDLYRDARRIKTRAEVAAIEATENAGMAALQRAIDVIASADIRDGLLLRGGVPLTGEDLILVVESHLLTLGCTTNGSICCGGPDSADPHRASSDVLRVGLPIVLDIFPFDKTTRYWGDMTRTVVRGTPPPEVRRMWEATLEAQQAGLDAVAPGANGRDIHRACCEVFAKWGYGSLMSPYDAIESSARFIHGTGHGLGLEIHEFPRIGDVDVTLEVGDIITVEPGLYDPAFGGIRIEDLVVVEAGGCRNLTTLPKIFELDG